MQSYDVVIVGAGHGGAQAAVALRQARFAGSILMIGDEPDLPYERPPLSKEYLAGEKPFERLLIRPPAFWSERQVDLRLGSPVVKIDPVTRRVVTAAGEAAGYDRLVWATGGRPRRLICEGGDLAGVHAVRSRADVDRMIGELAHATRAVVIGGGYIGLEAAAVLTKLGKAVVVVEALDRVLARVAGEPLSRFYEKEHRRHGVDVRLATTVDGIVGEQGRVTGVRLAGGDVLPADLVVVGIGIVPATEVLLAAGAAGGNGVHVDARCRTSLKDVYAIGDCASHPNPFAGGERIRLESVQNANDQAAVVAREIVGDGSDYHAVPWFWSNQYDLKLQTVGLSAGHDTALLRGDPAARRFSIVYLKEGAVVALDCVNAVKDYVQGRKLVEAGAIVDRAQLTNPAIALKDVKNLLPLG